MRTTKIKRWLICFGVKSLLLLAVFVGLLSSCNKDKDEPYERLWLSPDGSPAEDITEIGIKFVDESGNTLQNDELTQSLKSQGRGLGKVYPLKPQAEGYYTMQIEDPDARPIRQHKIQTGDYLYSQTKLIYKGQVLVFRASFRFWHIKHDGMFMGRTSGGQLVRVESSTGVELSKDKDSEELLIFTLVLKDGRLEHYKPNISYWPKVVTN